VRPGRITAVVGESGSGKSTLARAILRLPPAKITQGSVTFEGRDLMGLTEKKLRDVRGRRISMVFQNPMTSMNPLLTVRRQMADTYRAHVPKASDDEVEQRSRAVLGRLGIDESRLSAYPHELSGGMTQRVMIAMGLISGARFVIADEPTTSLDVLVERAFLRTVHELCVRDDVGVLLVSHNMGVVEMWADDVAVMYAGRIVEAGPAEAVLYDPKHPYTQRLVGATPALNRSLHELVRLGGSPPSIGDLPPGCPFHPRCPVSGPLCSVRRPAITHLHTGAEQSSVVCLRYESDAQESFREGGAA
jgi:oligopeptide/dipeptide ABC transporter ATP-binding protein